jgi:hypothetical protein
VVAVSGAARPGTAYDCRLMDPSDQAAWWLPQTSRNGGFWPRFLRPKPWMLCPEEVRPRVASKASLSAWVKPALSVLRGRSRNACTKGSSPMPDLSYIGCLCTLADADAYSVS